MTTVRNIAAGVRSMTSNAFLVDGDRPVLVDAGDGFDAVDHIEAATGDIDAVVRPRAGRPRNRRRRDRPDGR
ncbi:hypothetical protein BRC63_01680 [Halobacteriales archaeon QH_10_70_21]|nr:MAG: hypothetical protein BRC63_01680 [Halobacteriales archaeon QH_10_70_21]